MFYVDITDKKKDIIMALQTSDDEQLIEEVYELLHPAEAVESISTYDLPEDLQIKLTRALEDYNAGRYITHEQMKQKMKEWLVK